MLQYSHGFGYCKNNPHSEGIHFGIKEWMVLTLGVLMLVVINVVVFNNREVPVSRFVPTVNQTISTTNIDSWTRSDGETGAFLALESEGLVSSLLASNEDWQKFLDAVSLVPVVSPLRSIQEKIVEPISFYFQEPDFLCEYLDNPNAFHHCMSVGMDIYLSSIMAPRITTSRIPLGVVSQMVQ